MDSKKVQEALAKAKEQAKKRNFSQAVDLIIVLQNLDLKKPEQKVDSYISLTHSKGKKVTVCGLVGPELKDEAQKVFDHVIPASEFEKFDKKAAKKLADSYDYFVAQANIMAKVATAFGKVFGPRGKMPNPKAGCVVPPKASLAPLYDKLQRTLRLQTKGALMLQNIVGNEQMKEEEVIDNIMSIYKHLLNSLPNHENNIKAVYVKLSMGKPVRVI